MNPSVCAKDPQGLIYLRGRLTDSSPAAITGQAFTLPDGFRSVKNNFLSIAAHTSDGFAFVILKIYHSGNADLDSGSAATIDYIYLDGAVFDSN